MRLLLLNLLLQVGRQLGMSGIDLSISIKAIETIVVFTVVVVLITSSIGAINTPAANTLLTRIV
jgi:hypothetical protein